MLKIWKKKAALNRWNVYKPLCEASCKQQTLEKKKQKKNFGEGERDSMLCYNWFSVISVCGKSTANTNEIVDIEVD